MCLKIRVMQAIRDSFSFALNPKRISVMFGVIALTCIAIFFSIIALIIYLAGNAAIFGVAGKGNAEGYTGSIAGYAILLIVIAALSAILSILIKGMFIHNYTIRKSSDSIIKSVEALNGRMMPLIGLTLLIVFISMLFSMIPFLGGILNLFFSLAVLFSYQEVMLAKKGAIDSIRGSYNIFRENWIDALVSIIVLFAVTLLVIAVFAIPVVLLLISAIASVGSVNGALFVPALINAISDNAAWFIISGLIFVVGIAIMNLVNVGFLTEIYLELKGGKAEKKASREAEVREEAPKVIPAQRNRAKRPAKKRARKKKKS